MPGSPTTMTRPPWPGQRGVEGLLQLLHLRLAADEGARGVSPTRRRVRAPAQVVTEGEFGIDPPTQDQPVTLIEPGALRSIGKIGQWLAAPQGKRCGEAGGSRHDVALLWNDRDASATSALRTAQVHPGILCSQPVAVGLCIDPIGTEGPPKSRNVGLDGMASAGRRVVGPHLIDEPLNRDGLADMEGQDCEDGALEPAGDPDRAGRSDDFE